MKRTGWLRRYNGSHICSANFNFYPKLNLQKLLNEVGFECMGKLMQFKTKCRSWFLDKRFLFHCAWDIVPRNFLPNGRMWQSLSVYENIDCFSFLISPLKILCDKLCWLSRCGLYMSLVFERYIFAASFFFKSLFHSWQKLHSIYCVINSELRISVSTLFKSMFSLTP